MVLQQKDRCFVDVKVTKATDVVVVCEKIKREP